MNDRNKAVTLLFNPFVYIAGLKALLIGVPAMLLAAYLGSLTNTHFDGVPDMHTGPEAPLWIYFSEVLIDWLSLSVVLLLFGLVLSKTSFRIIDVVGTQALARWPTVFMSLLVLPHAFKRFMKEVLEQLQQGDIHFKTLDAVVFLAVSLGIFVFLCWMFVLMYKAFSLSCNVKGGKAIIVFIVSMIVAEVIAKISLYYLFRAAGLPTASSALT